MRIGETVFGLRSQRTPPLFTGPTQKKDAGRTEQRHENARRQRLPPQISARPWIWSLTGLPTALLPHFDRRSITSHRERITLESNVR